MSETQSEVIDDIVVHQGLPPKASGFEPLPLPVELSDSDDSSPVAENTAELDGPLAKYQELRQQLAKAEQSADAEAYLGALSRLIQTMKEEVQKLYLGQYGDLAHTMVAWSHKVDALTTHTDNQEQIKSGRPATVRSNTLDSRSIPHGTTRGIGRDGTDTLNSHSFASDVVEFVAERGGKYLTATVVDGSPISPSEHIYSTHQVATTASGLNTT